ncbi:hypothetical protein A1F96_08006 [Pyrenophora tritici-repentis]|nr:hypothetical protein A1F96_08006 [Pyrenophora tritici-repentis]
MNLKTPNLLREAASMRTAHTRLPASDGSLPVSHFVAVFYGDMGFYEELQDKSVPDEFQIIRGGVAVDRWRYTKLYLIFESRTAEQASLDPGTDRHATVKSQRYLKVGDCDRSYILVGIHRTVAYRSGYYPKTDACPFDWELRPTLTERLDVFVTSALRSSANALIMSSQFQNWTSNPEETHGSLMAISLWAMGGVSLLFLVIRCYIRQKQKKFWYDDGVLVVSWFLLLVQIILNQLNINLGFGKHALDINFANFERITYYGASGLTVSIFAIILSKISFGLTLLRLTEGWLKAWVWFAIATLFIFAVPVAIIPW